MCSLGTNWQYIIIGLDNGLALNRRQAIIFTNDDLVNWHIYAQPQWVNKRYPNKKSGAYGWGKIMF